MVGSEIALVHMRGCSWCADFARIVAVAVADVAAAAVVAESSACIAVVVVAAAAVVDAAAAAAAAVADDAHVDEGVADAVDVEHAYESGN